MFKQFVMDMKLRKDSFCVLLFAGVFGFLVGFALLCGIMFLDGEAARWFCLGTVLAMAVLLMCAVIFYGLTYRQELMIALSMGRTRREFLCAYTLRLLAYLVLGYGLLLGLYRLELALGEWLFAPAECEITFDFLLDWRFILPTIPAVLLVTLFVGALYSRFGKKAGWVMYIVFLALCLLAPRLIGADPEDTSPLGMAAMGLQSFLRSVPVGVWAGVGTAAAVGMLVTIICLNRKQMVR